MASPHRQLLRALPACAVLAALAMPAPAFAAATIHVDSSSSAPSNDCGRTVDPCPTLTAALAHATGGEVVVVAPGSYEGAAIDVPVHLRGAHAGVPGPSRGSGSGGSSTIRGALVIRATVSIDGFAFSNVGDAPTLHFTTTTSGASIGASVIENNTFAGTRRDRIVHADAPVAGLRIAGNLFDGTSGIAAVAVSIHGELVGGIGGVVVERNRFTGFPGAAIELGSTPGAQVRDNVARANGSLLVATGTGGSPGRMIVSGNESSRHARPAIRIGAGVGGIHLLDNELRDGDDDAVQLGDLVGSGATSDVQLRGNDITGFATALDASGAAVGDTVVLRGNRIVDVRRGGRVLDNRSTGSIDARRNWWGRSAGLDAGDVRGTRVDSSEPLRLVGVEAPATLFVGGSGVVGVRLVGPVGGAPEADTSGFPVAFSSSNAGIELASVPIVAGRASTMLHAGSTPGVTTTVATLDGESVRATTRIVGPDGRVDDTPAEPSVAEAPTPATARYLARTRMVSRTLRFSLSRGFKQYVRTNRHASVRTTYVISHYDARRLGLRPRTNHTRQPFVIARVHTRPIRGTRVVTAPVNARPAFALRRAKVRIAVYVRTVVRTRDGQQRNGFRRIVIPANAI